MSDSGGCPRAGQLALRRRRTRLAETANWEEGGLQTPGAKVLESGAGGRGVNRQRRRGGPYLLTAGPRHWAAGCGLARGTLRGEEAQLQVRGPRHPGMRSVCAKERAPSPGVRGRGGRCRWVPAWRLECVRTRGPRSPGAAAAAVSHRPGRESGAPCLPSPAPRRAPALPGLTCGRGAASAAKPG